MMFFSSFLSGFKLVFSENWDVRRLRFLEWKNVEEILYHYFWLLVLILSPATRGGGGLSLDLGLPGETLHKWLAQKWKHRHSLVSPNRLGCTFRLKKSNSVLWIPQQRSHTDITEMRGICKQFDKRHQQYPLEDVQY